MYRCNSTFDLIRRFTLVMDDDHGTTGWRMDGMDDFMPVTGFGLAHDALEHFDGQQSMEAECMAFGSMLWGRGQMGWWERSSPEADYVNQTHGEFAELIMEAGGVKPCKSPYNTFDDFCDHTADMMVAKALACMPETLEYCGYDYDIANAEQDMKNARTWLILGVNQAEKRWGRAGGDRYINLFDTIKDIPIPSDDYVGAKLVIRVDTSDCRMQATISSYDDVQTFS